MIEILIIAAVLAAVILALVWRRPARAAEPPAPSAAREPSRPTRDELREIAADVGGPVVRVDGEDYALVSPRDGGRPTVTLLTDAAPACSECRRCDCHHARTVLGAIRAGDYAVRSRGRR